MKKHAHRKVVINTSALANTIANSQAMKHITARDLKAIVKDAIAEDRADLARAEARMQAVRFGAELASLEMRMAFDALTCGDKAWHDRLIEMAGSRTQAPPPPIRKVRRKAWLAMK